jgi:hypothetical protein
MRCIWLPDYGAAAGQVSPALIQARGFTSPL